MVKLFKLDVAKAIEHTKAGEVTVGVFGLGYVGLPLGIGWALAGANVFGVTKNKDHLKLINAGSIPFPEEKNLEVNLKQIIASGRFKVYDNNEAVSSLSDVKLITVPVPLEKTRPNFSAIVDVCDSIGSKLTIGDFVILESSVPPGTTAGLVKKSLEEKSNLVCGKDFGLAYSPERIYVGRALDDLIHNYPKVIGADDRKSRDLAAGLYSTIAKRGVIQFNTTVEAELEKLFEGVYRDVNIALANELSALSEKMGTSYQKIREAANSQPYCHLHVPGIGVGGYCIPIYPIYLIEAAHDLGLKLKVISTARNTNDRRPFEVTKKILAEMKDIGIQIEESEVFMIGLAFRQNTSDIRSTPSLQIIKNLRKHVKGIKIYDPLVTVKPKITGARIVGSVMEGIEGASVLIVAVGHDVFKSLNLETLISRMKIPFVVMDAPGVFKDQIATINKKGKYISLGEASVKHA